MSAPLACNPGLADTIYRRFFKAGIATMFTFGCVLGGINLAIMASRHELASLEMRAITWAHAHAQVAGWVTFFVMGFAYQALPRFKSTALWRPRLAAWTLPVMAVALTLRTLADIWLPNPLWSITGRMAGAAELAVVIVFVCIITQTIRKSRQPAEPYERFLFAALGWMVAAFAFDLWIFSQSAAIAGYRQWVQFIGLWDAPWRDAQLLGFAGGMILGVSQRFLPFIYGSHKVPARTSRLVFYLWNLSVAGNIVAYSMLIRTHRPLWGIALELSILGLFAAVATLVRSFRLFSMRVEHDRSLPFLRAAYFWALVALTLFALLPVYTAARGVVFSLGTAQCAFPMARLLAAEHRQHHARAVPDPDRHSVLGLSRDGGERLGGSHGSRDLGCGSLALDEPCPQPPSFTPPVHVDTFFVLWYRHKNYQVGISQLSGATPWLTPRWGPIWDTTVQIGSRWSGFLNIFALLPTTIEAPN